MDNQNSSPITIPLTKPFEKVLVRTREIEKWLVEQLAKYTNLEPHEIDLREPFESYGLSSLQAISLSGDLQNWLGRPLPAIVAFEYPTIAALAKYLAGGKTQEESLCFSEAAQRDEPIAIIGIGCRFPGESNSPSAFWELIKNGMDAVTVVPAERWDVQAFYDEDPNSPGKANTRWGGFLDKIDQFDAHFFGISPREAARMDPQQRLLLEVAWEALEDGGQIPEQLAGSQTGVFVGVAANEYRDLQFSNPGLIDAYAATGTALSILANRISYVFDFHGPSLAVDTACSASLVALHLACNALRNDECSMALAGGVNLILSPALAINFSKAGVMSPQGRCRTFDARADGYVRGEGAGLVVLKPLSRALADKDPIYAVIRGSAVGQDGRTNGLMAPSPLAQEAVIREAYRRAKISPAEVHYVEAHGTGTLLGDPIEARALGAVLSAGRPAGSGCAVGSVKTNIGHLEAAAGIAGLIKVALSLKHRMLVPSLNFEEPNPHIPFDELCLQVQRTLAPWPAANQPALAGVSSFGFGGTNAHVVLEEAPERLSGLFPHAPRGQTARLLPLSARSPEALRAMAQSYQALLAEGTCRTDEAWNDLCFTSGRRRTHHDYRLAVVGSSPEAVRERLGNFLAGDTHPHLSCGQEGCQADRKVVFVCPGQGSQWLGMGRKLLACEPVFREAIQQCDSALQPLLGWSLFELLTGETQASCLEEIDVVQPALFAIEVSLAMLWRSWGVEPDAVIGHSMGEVAAAYIAGVLTLADAAKIICLRSQLLKRASGQGAMLMVELSATQAQAALEGYEDRASLAVSNSPTSSVLSGEPVALQAISETLQRRGVFCRWVKVDVAAHSVQMEALSPELVQSLHSLAPRPASVPIYATVSGEAQDGLQFDAAYWGRNLREPVQFSRAVQQLVQEEAAFTFLELSPHPILLAAIRENLASRSRQDAVLPSMRHEEDDQTVIFSTLGALYTLGHSVNWRALYPDGKCCQGLPTYPWQRERFWFDVTSAHNFNDNKPGNSVGKHPFLGRRLNLSHSPNIHFWEADFDKRLLSRLNDHRLQGNMMLSPMAYLEMALAAAAEIYGSPWQILENVKFTQALVLSADELRMVQVCLSAEATQRAFHIYSCSRNAGQPDMPWTLHASGNIDLNAASGEPVSEKLAYQEFQSRSQEISGQDYYRSLRLKDLEYGSSFQTIRHMWLHGRETLAQLEIPQESDSHHELYLFHPALLESCTHLLTAAGFGVAGNNKPGIYLPMGIDTVQICHGPGSRLWGHAQVCQEEGEPNGHLCGNVSLFDGDGRLVARLLGLRLQYQENKTPQAAETQVLSVDVLLAVDPQARQHLVEGYLCERIARVLLLPASKKLNGQQAMNSLGLDSLMALQLKNQVETDLGVTIPLVKFFQGLSIRQVAGMLLEQLTDAALAGASSPAASQEIEQLAIVPDAEKRHQPFPLTEVQQAYWIGRSESLELGNISCHIYTEIDFETLDLERFNYAWQLLIQRHGMLRCVVNPDGRQQILEDLPTYQIGILDLRHATAEETTLQLDVLRNELSHQMFATDHWPLFEVRASLLPGGRVRVHFSIDVLIADAWSLAILDRELARLYRDPKADLPPLVLSFRDYVTAINLENTEMYRRSWEYWRERLATLPPAPDLPLAKDPASISKPRFVRRTAQIEPERWSRIKQRAVKAGVTPSGVLLACFADVLAAWSKTPKFTINLTLFNRLNVHPQVNDIIGDFTSLTMLAVDGSAVLPFSERARRLQEQLWEDLDHRYVSGVQVLRELSRAQGNGSRGSMPVVFTSTLIQGAWGGDDSMLFGKQNSVYGLSQTPQVWLDHQVLEQGGTLVLNWDAVEELFPEGMLDAMWQAYLGHILQLAQDENSWDETERGLLPLEQRMQRAAINRTQTQLSEKLLHELFAIQLAERPEQAAVITPTRALTYQELASRANRIGHRLRQWGASPNQLVAVIMEKGWEQVVAVMGILACGAAYLPINPELPQERVRYLLENGEVTIALTQSWLNERFVLPENIKHLAVDLDYGKGFSDAPLDVVQKPEDLAYVIYTSGSTGQPKGVAIDHRGAVNTILDINQRYGVEAGDRVLAVSSLHFDLSVYDIFGLLAVGGTIVMPADDARRDPAHWAALIQQEGVTLWNSVPALMEVLVDYAEGHEAFQPKSLRLVMLSGDWIPVALPQRIRKVTHQEVALIGMGGATEASIWSIYYPIGDVNPDWKSIPYGRPLANQTFHVLDSTWEERPVWVSGDLFIGGIGLAKCYWRDEAKTDASFLTHPRTGERLYRTGDRGRYLPDGNIEFLGREDFQVKIQGHRIELGEIEATLAQYPGVQTGVALAVGEPRGHKRLASYVVLQRGDIQPVQDGLPWDLITTASHQLQAACQERNACTNQDQTQFLQAWQDLEHAYAVYVCRAFAELGFFAGPNESHSVDEMITSGRVLPHYRQWLMRALAVLKEKGWLEQEAAVWKNLLPLPTQLPEGIFDEHKIVRLGSASLTTKELELFLGSGEGFAAILTGEMSPAEFYISENMPGIFQKAFDYCYTTAQDLLRVLLTTLPSEKKVKIVEVGAGYGSMTEYLLPPLSDGRSDYQFTDISTYFFNMAKKKWADRYPFVRYNLLNIEQNPQPQGYALHSFDIVAAAGVLHATRRIDETLRHVRALLAPHGWLFLVEPTRWHHIFNSGIMGLQPGFDRFEDYELRGSHPLLTADEWREQLLCHGFEDVAIFSEPGSLADHIGVSLIVARASTLSFSFDKENLRDFLKQRLPAYMVPTSITLLESLPLTPTGKVDRRALVSEEKAGGEVITLTAERRYVAPRTALEKMIVDAWTQVLNVEQIGIYENFADLGGDSLHAALLISRLRDAVGVKLPLTLLFEATTVAELAEKIETLSHELQLSKKGSS